jgi:hypothetical protein
MGTLLLSMAAHGDILISLTEVYISCLFWSVAAVVVATLAIATEREQKMSEIATEKSEHIPFGLFRALTSEQKAAVFDTFIERVDGINKGYGKTFGTYQILDLFDEIATEKGFVECPHCHKKKF